MTSSTRALKTTLLFTFPFLLGAVLWCVWRPIALRSQLQNALDTGDYAVVKALVAQGANPNSGTNVVWRITPIEMAIRRDDNKGLAFLLKRGAKATAWGLGSSMRISPLVLAARRRNVNAVEMLLSHGARVDSAGNTHDFTIEGNPAFFFNQPKDADEERKQRIIVNHIKQAAKKSSQ